MPEEDGPHHDPWVSPGGQGGTAGPGRPPPGVHGYPPPRGQGYPPPGGDGYPPPGGYPPGPPPLRPGIIPLRPLGLGDIYDGAIKLVRGNPLTVLGLSAAVVSIAQVVPVIIQAFTISELTDAMEDPLGVEDSGATEVDIYGPIGDLGGMVFQMIVMVFLTGLVTAIAGRAIFGQRIRAAEAWRLVRPRILPLIGLAVVSLVIVIGYFAVFVGLPALLLGAAGGVGPAILGGVAGGLIGLVPAGYLWVKLSLAPPATVFERAQLGESINRSFILVRGAFWRVLGIELLTLLLIMIIAFVIAVPFGIIAAILLVAAGPSGAYLFLVLSAIGGIIGGTITAPFQSTVIALLYTDRRMRAEAFDLRLRAYAAEPPTTPLDDLWDPARS